MTPQMRRDDALREDFELILGAVPIARPLSFGRAGNDR